MALDEHCKSALIATRVSCADVLAPLAGRLIYDLRTHRDLEGGPILSAELAGELDAEPTGRAKIMRLWEEMTRKGVRGWRVLMRILEKVNPNMRMVLEDTAEQIRARNDYGSPQPVAHQNAFYHPMHPGPYEEAGFLPGHHPMPREAALNIMHNEAREVESQQACAAPPQPLENGHHHMHMQPHLADPERESSGAMEEERFYRNSPLSAIGEDARHLLADTLDSNKELVIRIGQELQAPPDVLTQCRWARNSSGLLFSQLNHATVHDLCLVLKKFRMEDLSDKLVQCMY